jgi:hypothetical protein
MTGQDRTARAVSLITAEAKAGHDVAGWLADVLARAAARLGSSEALLSGRPGSWEADLVRQLLQGTVGDGGEYLDGYK